MSYRRMKHRDLWEIYRHWRAGQSLARIAAGERRERKTVRRYLRGFAQLGCDRDGPVVERQRFCEMVTPSRSCWATQLRMVPADGSYSRANSCGVLPACTNSTICWRNSGGYA